jgi:hypothetical protein
MRFDAGTVLTRCLPQGKVLPPFRSFNELLSKLSSQFVDPRLSQMTESLSAFVRKSVQIPLLPVVNYGSVGSQGSQKHWMNTPGKVLPESHQFASFTGEIKIKRDRRETEPAREVRGRTPV